MCTCGLLAIAAQVTGLGPVGLAVAMLARGLGVRTVYGVDMAQERCRLAGAAPGTTQIQELHSHVMHTDQLVACRSCSLGAVGVQAHLKWVVTMNPERQCCCGTGQQLVGQCRSLGQLSLQPCAEKLGLVDVTMQPGPDAQQRIVSLSEGGCEVAVDCSGCASGS